LYLRLDRLRPFRLHPVFRRLYIGRLSGQSSKSIPWTRIMCCKREEHIALSESGSSECLRFCCNSRDNSRSCKGNTVSGQLGSPNLLILVATESPEFFPQIRTMISNDGNCKQSGVDSPRLSDCERADRNSRRHLNSR